MQQFDINDAFGNRIGSISPSSSFIDGFMASFNNSRGIGESGSLASLQTEAAAARIIQIIDFVNQVTNDISILLDEFNSIHNGTSGIDVSFAETSLADIAETWESKVQVMNDSKYRTNVRKMEKYLEKELLPLLQDVDATVMEAREFIKLFRSLEQLFNITNDLLFHKANLSIDRLDSKGFFTLEVKDPLFLDIQRKYDEAADGVVDFHNEIEELIATVSNQFDAADISNKLGEIGSRSDVLQQLLTNFSLLIESREEFALKYLESKMVISKEQDVTEALSKIAAMLNEGLLTNEEFTAAKRKLLGD